MFLSQLLNFIFPNCCTVCKRMLHKERRAGVCQGCWEQLEPVVNFCAGCGKPIHSVQTADIASYRCGDCRTGGKSYFSRARSAGLYQGALKELIQAFKYHNQPHLGHYLAGWMAEWMPQDIGIDEMAAIVPVPLHITRLRQRGYNQSQILAADLGRAFGLPVITGGLYRQRFNQPQVELTHQERLKNMQGVFAAHKRRDITGLKLLLIDDVYTTGATMRECAKTLLAAGAAEVRALSLARTPDVHTP